MTTAFVAVYNLFMVCLGCYPPIVSKALNLVAIGIGSIFNKVILLDTYFCLGVDPYADVYYP
jgi:hypothetical protein